jgi:hypothetical protein
VLKDMMYDITSPHSFLLVFFGRIGGKTQGLMLATQVLHNPSPFCFRYFEIGSCMMLRVGLD